MGITSIKILIVLVGLTGYELSKNRRITKKNGRDTHTEKIEHFKCINKVK